MRIIICLIFFSTCLCAQHDGLYRQKVKTLDSTIETLYAVISGDSGEQRDWQLFEYLFADGAKLVPLRSNENGKVMATYLSPKNYVDMAGPYLIQNGFFEKEIYRVTETFGNLTHVFSTYESYRNSKDTIPFDRGINSIQLMQDRGRWFIVNISWQSEEKDIPIPNKYLK